jgi:VWFA-related protein
LKSPNRITRSAIALTLAASTLLAQQKDKNAPVVPKLVDTYDVRVINVDVVVTDKKGNPIHGLKMDDFEIFENQVPKRISNFYAVDGDKTIDSDGTVKPILEPPPLPEGASPSTPLGPPEVPENLKRRIIVFVDNLSLNPFNRNRVFKQLKEFVGSSMRPGDEAMVATWNRSMKVRVPFTKDPIAVQQALDGLAGESALGVNQRSDLRSAQDSIRDATSYDAAVGAARQYSQSLEHDIRQTVASLNALMSTLAGVDGKKIMIMASEGMQLSPGKELFYFIDEVAREKSDWQSSGSSLLESMSFDVSNLITSVGSAANANGITMYTIHAGGLDAGGDMSAENKKAISFAVQSAGLSNSSDGLALVARMTGGLTASSTNNFAGAFQKISRDLDSYYSLGYRAGTERVDRQRGIRVKVKNKDYVVRSRESFVEKSPYAEMSDRVVANLLYKTKGNDLKVITTMGRPQAQDDGLYKVPVEIRIPMESMTILPQGDLWVGGFTVYLAVANKDGDMSDVSQKQHQVKVPAADMEKIKGKYYTYAIDLLMEKGVNRVSVGVVDDVSNMTGFAREQVIAQDLR